jgi:thiol:disulfide interchange protein
MVMFSISSALSAQDSIMVTKDSVVFSNMTFDAFQKQARFENKPYFIIFSASWCAPCQKIKKELFVNQQIAALANQNYLAYYMDLENFDDVEVNSKLFNVSQLPTILFFDPTGKPIDKAIGSFDGYYFFRKLRAHIPPSKWGQDWIGEVAE